MEITQCLWAGKDSELRLNAMHLCWSDSSELDCLTPISLSFSVPGLPGLLPGLAATFKRGVAKVEDSKEFGLASLV